MISFHCPECAIKLEVPEDMKGVSGPCPNCSAIITAPEHSEVVKNELESPKLEIKEEEASVDTVTEDDRANIVAPPQGNKKKAGSLFTVKRVLLALVLIGFNLIAAHFILNKDNETEVSKEAPVVNEPVAVKVKPAAKAVKQVELESVHPTEVEEVAITEERQPVVIEKEDGAVLIKIRPEPELTVEDILSENVKVEGQFDELELPSELSE